MPDYIESEQYVASLFPLGSVFSINGKGYRVEICGKPQAQKGECKTDVYIRGISNDGDSIELKISVKQPNADFLENKISIKRAREILGEDASQIIKQCTQSISKSLNDDYLVSFSSHGKTRAHTIRLGWKFEFLNKSNGDKSGLIELTEKQKHDIFAGVNLSEDKRNCTVDKHLIMNSGVANYILIFDDENMTRDTCLNKLQPVEEYAKSTDIFFACKALNYMFDKRKWDGPRPLSVYVNWYVADGKLNAELIFDDPLAHNGNEVGRNLRMILYRLRIRDFNDLDNILAPDVKCFR